MAQAVAGETAKPFVFVEPGAFNAMFMGVGILKVKSLYRKLRKLSLRYGGVIVFFDEADSLGNRGALSQPGGGWNLEPAWVAATGCHGAAYVSEAARSALVLGPSMYATAPQREAVFMGGMGMGGGMGTLQAMLAEMSGLTKPRGFVNRHVRRLLGLKPKPPPKYRILHIFATNMPGALDEAMLRPGRIDRLYKVGYPQVEGRVSTFRYYLAKVNNELTDEQVFKLATITPYATGASIKDMVNEALVIAIRDERETITWADIIQAKQLKEHGLPDDHEYIERERHSVAVHEASHAVVAYRLRRHMTIDIATIERRGDVGGFVSSIPPEDQFVQWRSERDVDVMTFLASLAGERLFFDGDNSAGVGGDMRGATSIAAMMEGFWAMGQTIGSYSVNLGAMKGAQPVEDGTDRAMLDGEFGRRIEAKLGELYDRTWAILEENRPEVLSVAHALETHKTITGDDVAAIIEGHRGSLVDGRPYHDPMFLDRLEAYHASVLAAHREHAEVEGAIPIPMPPTPSELIGGSAAAIGPGEGGRVS
jgi:ATP-dependent Zn protease